MNRYSSESTPSTVDVPNNGVWQVLLKSPNHNPRSEHGSRIPTPSFPKVKTTPPHRKTLPIIHSLKAGLKAYILRFEVNSRDSEGRVARKELFLLVRRILYFISSTKRLKLPSESRFGRVVQFAHAYVIQKHIQSHHMH